MSKKEQANAAEGILRRIIRTLSERLLEYHCAGSIKSAYAFDLLEDASSKSIGTHPEIE